MRSAEHDPTEDRRRPPAAQATDPGGLRAGPWQALEMLVGGEATDPLAVLAQVEAARHELDRLERHAMAEARAGGASWSRVAAALGLASRQAAEQRWRRLDHAAGVRRADASPVAGDRGTEVAPETCPADKRQQNDDAFDVPELRALRRAVRIALADLDAVADLDSLHPCAMLARQTLQHAVDALPPALYALAVHALADLDDIAAAVSPPAAVERSTRRLRTSIRSATP